MAGRVPDRSVEEPMKKVTVRLFASDDEYLKEVYGELGYNKAIRMIIRNHIRFVQERANRRLSNQELPDESTS